MEFEHAEAAVVLAAQWIKLGVELAGAGVVAVGVAVTLVRFVQALVARRTEDFNAVRLTLARYLALALEFQLGADIVGTAIAPTWAQIGQLAAVAVLRTALNFFLTREMAQEARETAEPRVHDRAEGQPPGPASVGALTASRSHPSPLTQR